MKPVLAVDIGGTSMRFRLSSREGVGRGRLLVVPTPNRFSHPKSPIRDIQAKVWEIAERTLESMLAGARPAAIGISFAGPIDARGSIVGAPTIWGTGTAPFPLAKKVEDRTGLPCFVINDVSAAAWKFSRRVSGSFSVITVSSGVGNKVFHRNSVLVNDAGFGGELGHCTAVGFDREYRCECGGINHIGAISSGRGVMNLLRSELEDDPSGYRSSQLRKMEVGRGPAINSEAFVRAVRMGDGFATRVLRRSAAPIGLSIANLYAMTGIGRTIIIGGFANALGAHYKKALVSSMEGLAFFGSRGSVSRLIEISRTGDLDCLAGIAQYAGHRLEEAGDD